MLYAKESTQNTSEVARVPAAEPALAALHFSERLSFETDCSDVYEAMRNRPMDFVLLDVRGKAAYGRSHVPGAISLPHREIDERRMSEWPQETLFVVYCAGPHCNGADKGALRLANINRHVKIMIGGMTGWADESFPFAVGDNPGLIESSEGIKQ